MTTDWLGEKGSTLDKRQKEMLNRLKRNKAFWEKNGPNYPYQIKNIKIAILPPEHYKHVRCISIPTGNRERIWGFKTQKDLEDFIYCYNALRLFSC
jgi:hypothetical protein